MYNSIRDSSGNVIGFRCFECGEIVTTMWGYTCNRCREEERRHKELIEALKGKKDAETD